MIATNTTSRLVSGGAFFLYLLFSSSTAIAQDDAEPEERSLMQIEVKADDRIPEGKSAFIQGQADNLGDKYLVEGIEATQPIHVGVFTQDTKDNVRVRIIKDDWEKAEQEKSTNGTSKAEFKFRTFDNFKIWVTADEETPYQLMVWIGDELEVSQPSIAVPASEYVEPKDNGTSNKNNANPSGGVSFSYLELGLIGVVLLLLIGFGIIFLRKKTN